MRHFYVAAVMFFLRSFPARPASDEPTSRKLDKYYSSLSYKQLRKLADLYRLDLRLFDYSLEDVLGFSLA